MAPPATAATCPGAGAARHHPGPAATPLDYFVSECLATTFPLNFL
jgi:hypothetical protein